MRFGSALWNAKVALLTCTKGFIMSVSFLVSWLAIWIIQMGLSRTNDEVSVIPTRRLILNAKCYRLRNRSIFVRNFLKWLLGIGSIHELLLLVPYLGILDWANLIFMHKSSCKALLRRHFLPNEARVKCLVHWVIV